MHRALPVIVAGLVSILSVSSAAQVPAAIAELVFGASKQRQVDATLRAHPCRGIRTDAPHPTFLWSSSPDAAIPVPHDRAAAQAWLAAARDDLGCGAFAPRFKARSSRDGIEVWEFEFVADGRVLFETPLRIYFAGARCVGIENRFPGPVRGADDPQAERAHRADVWFVQRDADGVRLVLAELRDRSVPTHRVVEVVTGRGVEVTLHEQRDALPDEALQITEFAMSPGDWPDQIRVDSRGIIWLTEPNADRVTRFDPATEQWASIPTPGHSGADGLWIDDRDRLWTGLYHSEALGRIDAHTGALDAVAMPYAPSNPAIPVSTPQGTVWITDHQHNRISEYDPVAEAWVQSLAMPTPSCWVVQGAVDEARGDVWFTEYNAHQIAHKPRIGEIREIPTPTRGGIAFLVFHDDVVFYSQWSVDRLGAYDTRTKTFAEYRFAPNEDGGPMWIAPNGDIVVGTRSTGFICVFDRATKLFRNHRIPTAGAGLKDGLVVAPDGAVWFTESGSAKIARLVVP